MGVDGGDLGLPITPPTPDTPPPLHPRTVFLSFLLSDEVKVAETPPPKHTHRPSSGYRGTLKGSNVLSKNSHVGLKGTERKQNGNPGGRGGPICWHDATEHAASLDLKAEKAKQ